MDRARNHTGILLLAALLAIWVSTDGCKQQAAEKEKGADAGSTAPAGRPYYQGLIDEYRADLAEDPHNLAATIGLANALSDSGQWKTAIRYYEAALDLDPHNADVITDLGTCYQNLGDVKKALSLYERALKVDTTHQSTLFHLGLTYGFDTKEYAKAIAAWERLLHVAPNHPQAAYLRQHLKTFRDRAGRSSGR